MGDKKNNNIIILLISVFFIGLLTALITMKTNVCDYFWHVKTGEYIVETGIIPKEGIFSWYAMENSLPWVSQEWGSEVILYYINNIFGLNSGIIYSYITSIIIVLLTIWFNREKLIKDITLSSIWIILIALSLMVITSPRPHMISHILFVLVVAIVYDFKQKENSKSIWFLPLIALTWINIHGGSANLSYIIPIILLVSCMWDFKFGRIVSKKQSNNKIKKLIVSIILTILACFINPHGFEMVKYPYTNMADKLMLTTIAEWSAPDIKDSMGLVIFIIIIIAMLILLVSKLDIDFTDFIIIGAMAYLTLKSVRFIALFSIVATFIIFKYINDRHTIKDKFMAASIVGAIGIILIVMFSVKVFTTKIEVTLPDSIVNYIKEEDPKRLFNEYLFGSYLIYNDIEVFIDGRADIYSKYSLKDYVQIYDLKTTNVDELLDKYKFDMFVIPNNAPVNYYLKEHTQYEKAMEEDNIVVYKVKNEN